MNLVYKKAQSEDIERIYNFSKQLIDKYENIESIEYDKVLKWVHRKIKENLSEYTCIYLNDAKVGYYHFFKNEDHLFEIDDLYIFSDYRNMGIGTEVINKCCAEADDSVYLYVFIQNKGAVSLYKKLGFEVIQTVHDSRYIMKKEQSNRKGSKV